MKFHQILMPLALALTACSETPVEEQGDEAIAEMENEIQEDAQSLEEAADAAVKALEEEIDAQLVDDGIGTPEAVNLPKAAEN
jgi:hypothetical protein